MIFKENLLKKIKIDKISEQVIASIETPEIKISFNALLSWFVRDIIKLK